MVKVYEGFRGPEGCMVTVNGRPLRARDDLRQHSSDGFEWGYEGAGPRQLALAILADALSDDARALKEYGLFLESTIAGLTADRWLLDENQIQQILSSTVEVPMTLAELMSKVRGN